MTEIRVPTLGESVTEATIGRWFKKAGDAVAVDEPLVEPKPEKAPRGARARPAGPPGETAPAAGRPVAGGALPGKTTEGPAGAPKPPSAPAKPAAAPAAA